MVTTRSDQVMRGYYKERAPVYDRVYAYPERQNELRYLEGMVAEAFTERTVLEVAAGTGYWSQFIAQTARSLLATDATSEALSQLEKRGRWSNVSMQVVDAYSLSELGCHFDAAFAGLWFSHVPVERRLDWIDELHQCLLPGARVVFLDNSLAQCKRLPITYTDAAGNTYQDRQTDSGEVYRVLKNFPTQYEMTSLVADVGTSHSYREFEHFWRFQYTMSEPLQDDV